MPDEDNNQWLFSFRFKKTITARASQEYIKSGTTNYNNGSGIGNNNDIRNMRQTKKEDFT